MNYILFGSNGKMGQLINEALEKKGHKLVKGFSSKDSLDTPVAADIAVDFSHADFFDEVLSYCLANKIPLVSGTTGLNETQLQNIKEASSIIPLLWASNTSVGVQVLRNLLEPLKEIADWDFHIVESHHVNKKDSPSGTAKTIAADVKEVIGRDVEISALRGGGVFGEHEVRIMGEAETITIKHTALSRALFANGAVKAVEFLKGKSAGLYTMKEVLGL